jgi:hypothetical protein
VRAETTVPFRHYEDRNIDRLRRDSDSTLFEAYRLRSAESVPLGDSLGVAGVLLDPDSARARPMPVPVGAPNGRVGSFGAYEFSRVGFSATGERALVYSFRGCGLLCGEGGLFLLEKRGAGWMLIRQLYVVNS